MTRVCPLLRQVTTTTLVIVITVIIMTTTTLHASAGQSSESSSPSSNGGDDDHQWVKAQHGTRVDNITKQGWRDWINSYEQRLQPKPQQQQQQLPSSSLGAAATSTMKPRSPPRFYAEEGQGGATPKSDTPNELGSENWPEIWRKHWAHPERPLLRGRPFLPSPRNDGLYIFKTCYNSNSIPPPVGRQSICTTLVKNLDKPYLTPRMFRERCQVVMGPFCLKECRQLANLFDYPTYNRYPDESQVPNYVYPLGFNNVVKQYTLRLSDCKRCLEEYRCFPSEVTSPVHWIEPPCKDLRFCHRRDGSPRW